MADGRRDGAAAVGGDDAPGVPDDPGVMHDGAGVVAVEHRLGEDGDDVFAGHEVSGFIEEKAAVEVTVPGDAEG